MTTVLFKLLHILMGIFSSQTYGFLFLYETFCTKHSDKFGSADFKYDNNFLKLQPKITQIRNFSSQIWSFFCLNKCLHFDIFEGFDFKYDNKFSKLYPKNTHERYFWSQIWMFFICTSFCILENLRVLISNKILVCFKFQSKNTQIKHF